MESHKNAIVFRAGMQQSEQHRPASPEIESRWITTTMWQHFDHGADIGVHGSGPSLATALEEAAVALTAVVTDPATVAADVAVRLECSAPDPELLLVDWLNAVIYEMATRGMLFSEFSVTLEGEHLHGKARGESVDVQRHQPAAEPKGATFTALRVYQEPENTWHAQCVIDV
jgi:SHS2 domain-containing protein